MQAPVLNVVCSVCHKRLGYRPCIPAQAGKSTHGYCRPCWQSFGYETTPDLETHWKELEESLKKGQGDEQV